MAQAADHQMQQRITERGSINIVFLIAGIFFASWAGRLSVIVDIFDFSGLTFGSFLLCMTLGTLVGIGIIPPISRRINTRSMLLYLPFILAVGLIFLGLIVSITRTPLAAFAILFINGVFFGFLDIMMNVSGARVERHQRRSLMPIFHGFFSLGTLIGAGIATITIGLKMLTIWHFSIIAAVMVGLSLVATQGLSGWEAETYSSRAHGPTPKSGLQRRRLGTLILLGLMVGGLSFVEGSANDWIAVATVEGHDMAHQFGAFMFTMFVGAMTLGRFTGGRLIDRLGTLKTLMIVGTLGLAGICIFILGHGLIALSLAAILWGLGSSLGFPAGMSLAAASGSRLGPNAVSIISAFGYGGMMAGPPLIGFIADYTGLPEALWLGAIVMAMALLLTPRAARGASAAKQRTTPAAQPAP